MSSCSMAVFSVSICGFSCDPSLVVTEHAITGRETPQARPSATFDGTNTYGTFLSSHSSGRCSRISSGSASAERTMNSEMPRLSVFVAARKEAKVRMRWDGCELTVNAGSAAGWRGADEERACCAARRDATYPRWRPSSAVCSSLPAARGRE